MKKQFIYGMMAAAGLLFTGCSSEEFIQQENKPLEADQSFYVAMTIKGDVPGSRAASDNGTPLDGTDDFEAGTTVENRVDKAYFVFYDEDGNVVGDVVPFDLPEPDEVAEGNTVEKSYKSVVAVAVRKGEKAPAQVICYINPIQSGALNVNLNTIQTVSRSNFASGEGNNMYFAMSNSVYYPTEGNTSEPQIAVQIPADQLYKTETAAETALADGNTVDIYVERYATKLQFQAADPDVYTTAQRVYSVNDEGNATYTTQPVVLTFTPQYWAVNAQANRNYVIKSFRRESEDGILLGNNYTYEGLNNIINKDGEGVLSTTNSWAWNNPDYHRSYWGMSPAYFTAEYPEVSQDVIDGLEVNQTYIKYNELSTKGFAANNTTPQYFRETTVGSKALNANNPAAAVASVIYVGQYSVSVNGTEVEGNPGFYTYLSGKVEGIEDERPYVYFENNTDGSSKVAGGETMLKRFLAQSTCFFKQVVNGETVSYERMTIADDLVALQGALEVAEVSDAVKTAYDGDNNTKLKLQHNARTLQFKSALAAANIYVLNGNGYQQVVADDVTPENGQITLTQANLVIMRQVGYAYYYTTGLAYFNIPVKHYGWYRKGNLNRYATAGGALLENETLDWSKVRVGDFGMVRNHSYSINVSEIKGLASGIGGVDIPIVPPATPDDYFVAYSVRILKWAVVPVQNVKL